MGLLRALERFDPERGVPVWGYAVLFPSGARFVRLNEEERHCTGEVDRQQCVTRTEAIHPATASVRVGVAVPHTPEFLDDGRASAEDRAEPIFGLSADSV